MTAATFPPAAEFRRWLESQPKRRVIAKDWGCYTCPLVKWLTSTTEGCRAAYVRPDEFHLKSCWKTSVVVADPASFRLITDPAPLPPWANEFGLRIDVLGKDKADDQKRDQKRKRMPPRAGLHFAAVTAADCLRVLSTVEKDHAL